MTHNPEILNYHITQTTFGGTKLPLGFFFFWRKLPSDGTFRSVHTLWCKSLILSYSLMLILDLSRNPGSGWLLVMGSLGTEVNAECKWSLWLHVHEMIGCITKSEFSDLWCRSGFPSLLSFKQVFMPQPTSCCMPGAANYLHKHYQIFLSTSPPFPL